MKRLLALSSVLALTLVACAPTDGTGPIKIGYVGPLTGDAASFGKDTLNGVQMAVDTINVEGGINGRRIELIVEDARCNSGDASAAAQKLVGVDNVIGIIGGQCSSETLAVAAVANPAKVIVISPISSSPDITNAGDYIFRVYPSDGLKGKALGNYFQTAGFTKVAIISENTDFCQGIRTTVKKDLPTGIEVVFDEVVEPGTKDYRTLMTRLKDVKFDVLLANQQSDATVAEVAKQMRELGLTQQIVGTDTADSVTLGKIATEAVEGLKPLTVPGLDENTPTGGEFAKMYREKYGEPQQSMFFAALAHDALNILATGIEEAGTDGEKLKDALLAVKEYPGIAGTMSFDENGDIKGIPFAMKEFKGGVLQQSELIPLE